MTGEPTTRQTVVASANILYKLPASAARTALAQVLEPSSRTWSGCRSGTSRGCGCCANSATCGWCRHSAPAAANGPRDRAYHWVSAVAGGNVVGARADRYDPCVLCRGVWSAASAAPTDRTGGSGIEPPREVTLGVFRDRRSDARSRCSATT